MPLVNLGTQSPFISSGWSSFTPISLESGNGYLVEVTMTSMQPDLVYSRFVFRYNCPTRDTVNAASTQMAQLYFDQITQYFFLPVYDQLPKNNQLTIQVQRFPIYPSVSLVADVAITVKLDPAKNTKL